MSLPRYAARDMKPGLRVSYYGGDYLAVLTGRAKITAEGLYVEARWDDGLLHYYPLHHIRLETEETP